MATDRQQLNDGPVDLAVLIVNYFTAELCVQAIRSIETHSKGLRVSIGIVDNSCDSREIGLLRRLTDEEENRDFIVRVQASGENLGYAGGNWAAWQLVESTAPAVVLIMNPDCRIVSGTLHDLVPVAETLDVFGAVLRDQDRTDRALSRLQVLTGRGGSIALGAAPPSWKQADYVGGHFLAVSTELWRLCGGFDRIFFLYCEELDLTLRIRRLTRGRGGQAKVFPTLVVSHVGGASTRRDDVPGTAAFHANRSRILLYRRHGRLIAALPALLLTRIGLSVLLAAKGDRVIARHTVRGLWAGLRERRFVDC